MSYFNFFMLGISFFILYSSFLFFLIFLDKKDEIESVETSKDKEITIIIPAYNEEDYIAESIESCLNQDYPDDKLNIIVVNDGSTDRTEEICKKYDDRGDIKLISKEQSGKVPSCNYVLKNHVDTELFCILDADTYFEENSIKKLIPYFDDEETAAVLSPIKIKDPSGWVERIQHIEYYLSVFLRKVTSYFNGLYTTHGATVFRTSKVREVGYFDEDNLTEDMEICLNLIDHGYKVQADSNAFSYTIPPKTFKELYDQRASRWYTGFFENITDYKHLIFNKDHLGLGFVTIPYAMAWVFILPFVFLSQGYTFLENAFYQLKTFLAVNFNFLFILENYFGPIRIGLMDVILFTTILTFGISLYICYNLVDAKTEDFTVSAIFYLVLFTVTQSLFWLASVFKFLKGRKKEPWKRES